jgi:hypothetical protein
MWVMLVEAIHPEQLAMMASVLDEYCRERGICDTSREREDTARLIITLFQHGCQTAAELKEALQGSGTTRH